MINRKILTFGLPFLECRKNSYISKLDYSLTDENLLKSHFFRTSKKFPLIISGLKVEKEIFSFYLCHRTPQLPCEACYKLAFIKSAICRAILALCGDDADVRERIRHAVSVALMLVNTDAYPCDNIVP